MPQRKNRIPRLLLRIAFVALLGWAVALVRAVRPSGGWDDWSDSDDEWTPQPVLEDEEPEEEPAAARQRWSGRKVAASFTFATLFFAGAAFTAGAGDMVAKALGPAECAALMQMTGESEDVCALVELEEALPAPELAPEAPAPDALPAGEEPAAAPESAPAEQAPEGAADAALEGEPAALEPDANAADATSSAQRPVFAGARRD